jgi:hypothetical protein
MKRGMGGDCQVGAAPAKTTPVKVLLVLGVIVATLFSLAGTLETATGLASAPGAGRFSAERAHVPRDRNPTASGLMLAPGRESTTLFQAASRQPDYTFSAGGTLCHSSWTPTTRSTA